MISLTHEIEKFQTNICFMQRAQMISIVACENAEACMGIRRWRHKLLEQAYKPSG